MACNKILPPTPPKSVGTTLLIEGGRQLYPAETYIELVKKESQVSTDSKRGHKIYSAETYAQLLEQENEQLRLRNQQLQLRLQCLETKIDTDREQTKARKEQTSRYSEEIKKRDKIVGEIAETILQEFQRYKQALQRTEDEEIKVYSTFEDSPI